MRQIFFLTFYFFIFNFFVCNSQVEKYEKVILTRYFKPSVSAFYFGGDEFLRKDIKDLFFAQLKQNSQANKLKQNDYRNFIDFSNIGSVKEINYFRLPDMPKPMHIPKDKSIGSFINTYFKFFVFPYYVYKYQKGLRKFEDTVAKSLANQAESLARDRVADLFSLNQKGYFDYNKLLDEAKVKSNDMDDKISNLSVDNLRLYSQIADELISRNFIFVYNFKKSLTLKDYYDKQKIQTGIMTKMDGYVYSLDLYVFKINWTEEQSNYFYEKCWFDNSTISKKNECLNNFNKMKIPVELVYVDNDDVVNYSYLQGEKRIADLKKVDVSNSSAVLHGAMLKKVNSFKLRSVLQNDNRGNISSKIGKKESLFRSSRFVVYELYKNQKGDIKKKYKGVVVAKKPVDNSGNKALTTSFYQEKGLKLNSGMIMEQKELSRLNFSTDFIPILAEDRLTFISSVYIGIRFNGKRFAPMKGLTMEYAPYGAMWNRNPVPNEYWQNRGDTVSPWSGRWKITKEFYIKSFPYVNINCGVLFNYPLNEDGLFLSGKIPFIAFNKSIGPNLNLSVGPSYFIPKKGTDESKLAYSKNKGLQLLVNLNYTPNKIIPYTLKRKLFRGNRFKSEDGGFIPYEYPATYKKISVLKKWLITYLYVPHVITWLASERYRQNWYFSKAKRIEKRIEKCDSKSLKYNLLLGKYNRLIIRGEEAKQLDIPLLWFYFNM